MFGSKWRSAPTFLALGVAWGAALGAGCSEYPGATAASGRGGAVPEVHEAMVALEFPADRAATRKSVAEACQGGDAAKCLEAGLMWQRADGGPRDVEQAVAALTKACDAGLGEGCSRAGMLQREKRDDAALKSGAELLRRGCDAGDIDACAGAAVMAFEGQGQDKDDAAGVGAADEGVRRPRQGVRGAGLDPGRGQAGDQGRGQGARAVRARLRGRSGGGLSGAGGAVARRARRRAGSLEGPALSGPLVHRWRHGGLRRARRLAHGRVGRAAGRRPGSRAGRAGLRAGRRRGVPAARGGLRVRPADGLRYGAGA
jgi:hypothetical protein